MRSNASSNITIEPGNFVQVFINNSHEKGGTWSLNKVVSSVDNSSYTVCGPGYNSPRFIVALEDTRLENGFASKVVKSIDRFDDGIYEALCNTSSDETITESTKSG